MPWGAPVFSFDEITRRSELLDTFYARLTTLSAGASNPLNSRIPGSPFFTTVQAYVRMVSDAWNNLLELLTVYDPNTTTVEDSLAFFERPRLQPSTCTMSFTLIRPDATAAIIVPANATIQTPPDLMGRTRSYKAVAGFTIPAGAYYGVGSFVSTEASLAATLTAPQAMESVSGVSGLSVVAGVWKGGDNPFSDVTPAGGAPSSLPSWVALHASSFTMSWQVQGRDLESFGDWRSRCFARWDEQTTGSTAAAYESWARSYTSSDGDSPVSVARVTQNQVFEEGVSVAPPGQKVVPADNQEYIMAVEVAVALRSGAIPSNELLEDIGISMLPLIPHTDILWLRPPARVDMIAGTVSVEYRGLASYLSQATQVVRSFFIYDEAYPGNLSALGGTIHMADIIYAVKAIDPARIDDVKVTFALAGKVDPNGDLVLDDFDQLALAEGVSVEDAIVVIVDPVV